MHYTLSGDYQLRNPDLDLMSTHDFSKLVITTSLLINHINTDGINRIAFHQNPAEPVAFKFVAEKQPADNGLWYAGAYLPSVKSKPEELIMNCAVYTVDPRHDLSRATLVDARRDHYTTGEPGRTFSRQLPPKLTRRVIQELTAETGSLLERFDRGQGDWEIS